MFLILASKSHLPEPFQPLRKTTPWYILCLETNAHSRCGFERRGCIFSVTLSRLPNPRLIRHTVGFLGVQEKVHTPPPFKPTSNHGQGQAHRARPRPRPPRTHTRRCTGLAHPARGHQAEDVEYKDVESSRGCWAKIANNTLVQVRFISRNSGVALCV